MESRSDGPRCRFKELREHRPLTAAVQGDLPGSVEAGLWWLGQAGFAVRSASLRLLIDPYLSDSLARKYGGSRYPHRRMMDAPLSAEQARELDVVLCTHRHSDHMDPGTLPVLAQGNPRCLFVVPRPVRALAVEMGVPAERIVGLSDGERMSLSSGCEIEAVASAHEERERDGNGDDLYLGFVLSIGVSRIYHSGDCVPYAGLSERLAKGGIDAALLPINGRGEKLRNAGLAGNFHFEEAAALCVDACIPALLCHHFGMFDFNTADVPAARIKAKSIHSNVAVFFARTGVRYELAAPERDGSSR